MKKLEISKKDLKYNLEVVRNQVKQANSKTKIIAVVKANGMGLDLVQYSKFLIENGIEVIAVANMEEALILRKSGITSEILMLTPISSKKDLQLLIINDITLTIGSFSELEIAEEILTELNRKISAHIKVDTGFGRYGFLYDEKEIILETLKKSNNVEIKGMYTHFSNAIDEKYTRKQFNRFMDIKKYLDEKGYNVGLLHCSASTAFLKYPDMMLDCIRIGSVLQGRTLVKSELFKKVGYFKTCIQEIKILPKGYNISYGNTYKTKKKTKVAIIPVGYMDGLNRSKLRDDFSFKNNIISILMEIKKLFKNNSIKVKINNTQYSVIGRLGMYHAIIDITGNDDIKIGDEVELDITPLQANEEIRREYI